MNIQRLSILEVRSSPSGIANVSDASVTLQTQDFPSIGRGSYTDQSHAFDDGLVRSCQPPGFLASVLKSR